MSTTRRNARIGAAAPQTAARVLSAAAMAALNPAAAKAAMLYTPDIGWWNTRSRGDVSTSLLVSVLNASAATTAPHAIRDHLPLLDPEESP